MGYVNNKNNERRHSIKESEIKPITHIKANNENEEDFTKIDKLDFNQSNANTNVSILLMNFTNNLDNKIIKVILTYSIGKKVMHQEVMADLKGKIE